MPFSIPVLWKASGIESLNLQAFQNSQGPLAGACIFRVPKAGFQMKSQEPLAVREAMLKTRSRVG